MDVKKVVGDLITVTDTDPGNVSNYINFRWLALDKALDTVVDPERILITFYVQH